MSLNGLLHQQITISSKTGYNDFGRPVVSAAATVNARFQRTNKTIFNPAQVGSVTTEIQTVLAVVYVPADTTVAIDDKVTYDSTDYKVFDIYTAIDGNGRTNHLKLQLTKWKAT